MSLPHTVRRSADLRDPERVTISLSHFEVSEIESEDPEPRKHAAIPEELVT